MGILNVTPDSFSDGGRYLQPQAAIAHGLRLAADGAAIIDVGGESTRPGALPVGAAEELRRVVPVVEALAAQASSVQVSVDTSKAQVAAEALAAGASFVNDVSALRADRGMAEVIAGYEAECCLMHMRGDPRTMQQGCGPHYEDVVGEVRAFLEERMEFAIAAGIAEERLLLDPGIGFGKTARHNLELLARLDELVAIGRPILIGTSRKSFLGRIAAEARGGGEPAPVADRVPGTIATNVLAMQKGARVFRVHDVAALRDALAAAAATLGLTWTSTARNGPRTR